MGQEFRVGILPGEQAAAEIGGGFSQGPGVELVEIVVGSGNRLLQFDQGDEQLDGSFARLVFDANPSS